MLRCVVSQQLMHKNSTSKTVTEDTIIITINIDLARA